MTDYEFTARAALFAGVVAGSLFFVVPTIEIFRRPNFDIERHAISMLSLGEGGWIMKVVFIVSGLMTVLCAWGLHQVIGENLAGFTLPMLIALYGLGLVLAGIFDAPAGLGFPAGTPIDQQPVMTTGATLHSIAFMVAFGALILSCFAFAWYFAIHGQLALAALSAATGLVLPTLIYLGVSSTIAPGLAFYWAAMAGWAWFGVSLLGIRS
ncbi:DUF998 domain-containing protein [Altererythrobacter sp. CC-YST694]|uniref:DUF998 domain-containing protein n=1 Tax=Altererythrobacter sp. CC-YST694 TaxID=2755038 RepID=UPI001D02B18E|nr:DUF998 domain-containing protein [Altererythrobacter sp. CC-YST694]MCB5425451.1 DUF998 domain-containing protein [Altererythrobacter sp. CC-YST694]